MEYKHEKRKGKGGNRNQQNGARPVSSNQEIVFKWVPVKAERISPKENKALYEEYKEERPRMLRETVYNPDGTENKEGISRLRQAGLDDKAIFDVIAKGQTPNGFNYHHLFPRALSGGLANGPIQIGDEQITTLHDWRCMMPLPNSATNDIHGNVHQAMDQRNGPMPANKGDKKTYYIAMPLTAEEYSMYKTNPQSVKAELLIVSGRSFRTVDQRETEKVQKKEMSAVDIAKLKMGNGR